MTSPITVRLPELYPKQHAAIFDPARYVVIEASTKSGKTAGCMVWLLSKAMALRGTYWWVSPVFAQARVVFRRVKAAMPPDVYSANESELTITLANGSTIFFKSGDNPDSLFGEDVYAAVIDEATRVKEASWDAVRSTLTATRGPVRIIGNVRGRRNWAYRLARKAEGGARGFHYAKLTSADAVEGGILDADEIEDARAALPHDVFMELYMAEPSEDGSNPFGIAAIRECVVDKLAEGPAVCYGVDLAKSVDYTTILGLNSARHTCSFDRFQQPWSSTVLRIRSTVGSIPTLVDSTGVGDPILEELQKGGGNYEGFKFTAASKQQIMEGLAVAIQQRQIRFPEGPIVDELEEFEYVYTRTGVYYSAPEGLHDDCVCGLALANAHWRAGGPVVRFIG